MRPGRRGQAEGRGRRTCRRPIRNATRRIYSVWCRRHIAAYARGPLETFDDLKRTAERGGGLATVSTTSLRDMDGNQRLTRECAQRISGALHRVGLEHLPAPIPQDDVTVMVYVKGAPAGDLIDAVVQMTKGRDLHASMDTVRAAVATPQNEALEIVAKIRALVRDPAPPDETT